MHILMNKSVLPIILLMLSLAAFAGVFGQAKKDKTLRLSNKFVAANWSADSGRFRAVSFEDLINKKKLALPADTFAFVLKDGTQIRSSEMRLKGAVRSERLRANSNASRFAERLGGTRLVANLTSADGSVQVVWNGILRDGSKYIRQEIAIEPAADLPISEIRLIDLDDPGAKVVGTVKGSPIVAGNLYFGFEHPLSESKVDGSHVTAWMNRELPLRKGTKVTYSSVIGTTRNGQLRRDFLAYVERERAHPYRTFLHYNSWYDLGYFSKFDEKGALDVINIFGRELKEKRGVTLDSFLFDDGWDDPQTLWHFHSGFPNGFTPLKEAAAKFGTAPGVWMSPWGGYGKPKQERIKYGKEQGFETNKGGFALSGPKYYQRFRETCFDMIRKYGINQFKFDGTGNVNSAIPGSEFDSDFSAAIQLIEDLRAEKPDIYINLTTGTYPSPFWLQYADSIWRGGEDHDFAGVGSKRQQWITYRDADTYEGVVKAGPLYPVNSLMLHGLIYAKHAKNLDTDPNGDFRDEVHDYFGTGTQLQEMYITPALLKPSDWDAIAEAAKWSRSNADVLVDTHWVGGDPRKLEIYGWASWSPRKGILTLRNPSDKPQQISLDVAEIFELPAGAVSSFVAHSPWKSDAREPSIDLKSGQKHTFELKPFQVLNLEMMPRKR
jgi:hypothetical protein